jgi:hypothetical protein
MPDQATDIDEVLLRDAALVAQVAAPLGHKGMRRAGRIRRHMLLGRVDPGLSWHAAHGSYMPQMFDIHDMHTSTHRRIALGFSHPAWQYTAPGRRG